MKGRDRMRTLKFIVEAQNIKEDPNCDFSGLVKGTKGYLYAEFIFRKSTWDVERWRYLKNSEKDIR